MPTSPQTPDPEALAEVFAVMQRRASLAQARYGEAHDQLMAASEALQQAMSAEESFLRGLRSLGVTRAQIHTMLGSAAVDVLDASLGA